MIIRKALKKDMPCVLELIQELAIFEKEPDAVVVTVPQFVLGKALSLVRSLSVPLSRLDIIPQHDVADPVDIA